MLGKDFNGFLRLLLYVSSCVIAGCAGITGGSIDKVPDAGKTVAGIPYYEQSPFLLVIPDQIGGYYAQIVWLPDASRLRYIEPYQILASNNTTLNFVNGSLQTSHAVMDSTAVPKALLNVAVAAIKANAGVPTADTASELVPSKSTRKYISPYLFRVDLTGTEPKLSGNGGYMIELPAVGNKKPGVVLPEFKKEEK